MKDMFKLHNGSVTVPKIFPKTTGIRSLGLTESCVVTATVNHSRMPHTNRCCILFLFFFLVVLTNADGAFPATSAGPPTDATRCGLQRQPWKSDAGIFRQLRGSWHNSWGGKHLRHSGCGIAICRHHGSSQARPNSWLRKFNMGGLGCFIQPCFSRARSCLLSPTVHK